MSNSDSEDDQLNETLQFIANQLEENCNLKTTNMYGGQGGFGLVLFVYDKSDESQKYAVKAQSIINPNNGQVNQNILKQCREEASVMRECKHKNIVEIHSDFVLGYYHFIQMSLCSCSLNDWIQNNGQNPISDLVFLHYTNQIIDGLEYLHNLDYVLRDVSIRNILLTTEGVLKLCDFGLAKKYDNVLRSKALYTSHIQGVIFYFPPELHQAISDNKSQVKQTKEGDIWALGVCLSLLGGLPISYFSNSQHKDFEILDAPNFTEKANQLIKLILIRNPSDRPSFKQIREHIQRIFFSQDLFKIGVGQIKSKQNSQKTNNSLEQTNSTTFTMNSSEQTAVMFIDNSYIAQNLQSIQSEGRIDFNFMDGENVTSKNIQILENLPNNIASLLILGHLEIKLNSNFEKGESYLQRVKAIQNNNIDCCLGICESILMQKQYKNYPRVLEYLEICYKQTQIYWRTFYIEAWYFYEQQKYLESEEQIKKSVNQAPNSSVSVVMSLQALIQHQKDIQKAKDILENSISLNQLNDPIVYSRTAYFYQHCLKQPNLAINYYKRALNISKKSLMALSNLVLLFNQQNDLIELAKYKQLLLESYSDNSYTQEILGMIETDVEKKILFFNKAIELDPSSTNPYHQISEIYIKENKMNEAEENYNRILEINPYQSQAYIELGNIYMAKKELQKAKNYYKQALEKQNIQADVALYIQGLIFELNEDKDKALKSYKESIEKNPSQLNAYKQSLRILIKDNTSDIKQQIDLNKRSIEYNPLDIELRKNLISLYQKNEDYLGIINELEEILRIDPKMRGINEQIAYIEQTQQKNIEKSIIYYKKEIEITKSEYSLINLGEIYLYNKENYQLAQEYLGQALTINPNNTNTKFAFSILYIKQSKFEEAENLLNEIILQDPKHVKSYFELGKIYQIREQNDQKALQMYTKGLEIDSTVSIIHFNLGLIYSKKNNLDKAIEYFKQYYDVNKQDYQASYELGSIYLRKSDTQLALYYLTQSVNLNKEFQDGLFLLSQAYQKEKRSREAIQSLQKLRLLNPNRLDALQNLAFLELKENPQISTELYKQVILKDPLCQDAILNLNILIKNFKLSLIKSYEAEKNEEKQEIYLKQLLIIEPKSFKILRTLGILLINMQKKEEAVKVFQELKQINPNYCDTSFYLGQIYQDLYKDNNKAQEYYEIAERQGMESSLFYAQFGLIFIDKKQYAQALSYFKKSLKIKPIYPQSLYYIGWIYQYQDKDYKKAIKFYYKCIKEVQDEPKVYFQLGKVFQEIDYQFKAKEAFEKAISINPNFQYASECQEYINQNPTPEFKEYKQECSIF